MVPRLSAGSAAQRSAGVRPRRGLTLAEVMIALVLLGIIGAVFTRLLAAQGRFFNTQFAQRSARGAARAPMNLVLSELRMVQDQGGLDAAAADGKRVRLKVPYRFGILCGTAGGVMVASMLPVDSSVSATYAGWSWRAADGSYTDVVPDAPQGADSVRDVTGTASEAVCTAARIHKVTVTTSTGTKRTGRVVELRPAAAAPAVAPVFLWGYVAYAFKPSTVYPGRIGLYRIEADGTVAPKETEVMAPFDTSARFRFFIPGKDTSLIAPPASLANVRGLDLVLSGASAGRATNSSSGPTVNRLTTAVFFKNVRNF